LRADLRDDSIRFPVRTPDRELVFYRPADPEAVLNSLSEHDFKRDEQLPYWVEHWPAADVAVEYFSKHPLDPNAGICEIGCGLGVVATVLSQTCKTVIATDISRNGCRYAAVNLHTHNMPSRVVCADWRHSPFRGSFDIVVGVDILYEERWVRCVADFLWQSLAPGGMAMIFDPCRSHWLPFREQCRRTGFTCALAHRRIVNQGRTCVEALRMIR